MVVFPLIFCAFFHYAMRAKHLKNTSENCIFQGMIKKTVTGAIPTRSTMRRSFCPAFAYASSPRAFPGWTQLITIRLRPQTNYCLHRLREKTRTRMRLHCRNVALYLNIVSQVEKHKIGVIMKFRILLTLLQCSVIFVFFPGCGEKNVKTADSPTEVFKKIIAAIKRADVDAVEKLVSEDFEEESKEELAELRRGDEAMMREVDKNWGKVKIEYVSEKIDGDLAAVKVVISSDGEKEREQSFGFKRIGGTWKLLGDSEGRAVVKQLSLKGAPPDAVALEYIKYECKLSKELVMLCGGAKRRELEEALAASKNGNVFSELRIWTEELRELAAGNDEPRKDPKAEKRAGSTAEGCLDLSECTHAAVLETVDGDLAVVKVRGPRAGKVRKGRMYLRKFDGEWKIVWKYEYDRAKAARKGR